MSGRLLKHGFQTHPCSKSVYNLWRTKFYSISDSAAGTAGGSIVRKQCHQIQQSKPYSRFNHKAKELGLQTPTTIVSSTFSSTASSSSKIGLVGWYLGMVKSRPIVTKSITCALIYTAADLSSQTIAGQSAEGYDLVRTLRMASYGMFLLGPSLHFWFNYVSRLFPRRDVIATLKKIVMGQTLYGPAMTVVFFSYNASLQGESRTEIVARLKRDLVPTLISGVMYWPLCDFVTFKFIPVHLQPLVSNGFSYLWTIYMTYMASQEKVRSS
ncbi:OLC1v1002942C1 [Oldenlandia corymbosa var. corymbosa]|uniref:OLC1v1002942C1 n=1 Tax=Oldenlandia corymbosa var. corymbosa TaxID=529605 RepID=A0AAV1DAK9_OLDCO|nr:OLC1v1002942C1 [Oldenlandia corymbosa var. corymbosa]